MTSLAPADRITLSQPKSPYDTSLTGCQISSGFGARPAMPVLRRVRGMGICQLWLNTRSTMLKVCDVPCNRLRDSSRLKSSGISGLSMAIKLCARGREATWVFATRYGTIIFSPIIRCASTVSPKHSRPFVWVLAADLREQLPLMFVVMMHCIDILVEQ